MKVKNAEGSTCLAWITGERRYCGKPAPDHAFTVQQGSEPQRQPICDEHFEVLSSRWAAIQAEARDAERPAP